MAVRLQKFLAESGVASRRKCELLIAAGRVTVNGTIAAIGQTVTPGKDTILLDGRALAREAKVYVVLNKPAGVITTASDTHKRRTVLDCLTPDQQAGCDAGPGAGQPVRARVFPVGRLDYDTRGVLLLTNDGELANRLTHPRYGAEKVYLAVVDGVIGPGAVQKLERGVSLEEGRTAPAKVEVIETGPSASRIRLTLREGRKREVRRMCAKVGHPVIELVRESMAGITADGLQLGEWRYLTDREVVALQSITASVRDVEPRPR